jgi:hypothetical protein
MLKPWMVRSMLFQFSKQPSSLPQLLLDDTLAALQIWPKLAMIFGIDIKIEQRISMVLMLLGSMLLHASMLRHIWQSY